ncbi:type VI secretion system baseplate subunit TssF [Klebsiella pneumoniae]|nr:type VI secretion system baseplate subunit TssF [Klebsiella pneumoniae]
MDDLTLRYYEAEMRYLREAGSKRRLSTVWQILIFLRG